MNEEEERIIRNTQNYTQNIKKFTHHNNITYILRFLKFIIFSLFLIISIFFNKLIQDKREFINDLTIKKNSKKRGLKYMNICLKNILIYQKEFSINIFPKISVIIPIFNCQDFISHCIKSVENQNIPDFEIILVNDFSKDNSLNIIRDLQKNDKRIKILNNHKNMGTLYSRSVGALKAKGEYIFPLDNDDMLSDEDIFEKILKIAKINSFDIIEFKSFDIPNYNKERKKMSENYFNHHPDNLILHQPELGLFPISRNNSYFINDFHIWGKCIKTNIYKKAVYTLGEKRYSLYNCWTEDIIIVLIIFNIADSFIFINKYGIFHLSNLYTTTYQLTEKYKLINEIYFLDILIDILKINKISIKYIIDKTLLIEENYKFHLLDKMNIIYLNTVLKKIINSKFISDSDKKIIKMKFKINNLI